MLINDYLEEKYWYEIFKHNIGECKCDFSEGKNDICLIGKYLEGKITANEYLRVVEDIYQDLQLGTFIRTKEGELARCIGIERFHNDIYFVLDRKVLNNYKNINERSNKIITDYINKHSNILGELVEVGDIANGRQIIKISNGRLWYGCFGNEYIKSNITELLSKKAYKENKLA